MRVGGKHQQYVEEGESNELMSESYSRRSWKGIAIAFLVLGAVAAIVTLIVIYSSPSSRWTIEGTLTLDDVINGKYKPKSFGSADWTSGDSFMYLKSSKLWLHNISTNKTSVVVENSTWEDNFDSFYPSPSGKYILYSFNKTKQFRYSYNASFQVVTTENTDNPSKHNISEGQLLQYASWGPGDKMVYVVDNNIYYLSEYNGTAVNVTSDGKPGVIYNGIPDWVYEEEVLGSESALWWSTDGKYFAFLRFDDTQVKDMHYMHYGDEDEYYPTVVDIKYPKPGFANPEVSLYVVDTSVPNIQPQRVHFEESNTHYVTSVTWANKELAVMWGPRVQNQSSISVCAAPSSGGQNWTCKNVYSEESKGWLDARIPIFSDDGKNFFIIASNNGFKHLYMGYTEDKQKNIFLTDQNYEVTSIEHYDSANNTIYYIRTDGAEKRRLYRMSGIPDQKATECLSCETDCDWAAVSLFSKPTFYALTCQSPTAVPTVRFFRINDNTLVDTWETNEDLKNKLKNQTLADYRDFSANGDSIKIRVWVPKNFSESKKYPALVYVYGGPTSQMIQNSFGIDFGTYLVTNKNYLYVEIDGRGSGFRGDKILYQIYKRLGTVEIEDQIAAMRYLLRNHSFVDPNRVAIWGWSYGGYASAMTLAQGNHIFRCAMSVAPVTSWRYYDSIYTERYMLEPKDNPESYRTSQLMNHISDMKNRPFILLHGTADDNVHIQQTMMLTKALNNASILFDMHIYPDENHSIPKSQLHVYKTLEDFLGNCFA